MNIPLHVDETVAPRECIWMSGLSAGDERSTWFMEGIYGFLTGILYGCTSVIVGQPFDTIKTKMQAGSGFEKKSPYSSLVEVLRKDGIRGLYRGSLPPLMGSGIYRSSQFAVYEATYTALSTKTSMPHGENVVASGILASFVRSVIECPIEYYKVRGQLGLSSVSNVGSSTSPLLMMYTGFSLTFLRTAGALTSFFVLVDYGKRNYPEIIKQPLLGPFVTAGKKAFAYTGQI
jgi:solute carrier family 25 carnitine/acylcarnitine transporter 20/29